MKHNRPDTDRRHLETGPGVFDEIVAEFADTATESEVTDVFDIPETGRPPRPSPATVPRREKRPGRWLVQTPAGFLRVLADAHQTRRSPDGTGVELIFIDTSHGAERRVATFRAGGWLWVSDENLITHHDAKDADQ